MLLVAVVSSVIHVKCDSFLAKFAMSMLEERAIPCNAPDTKTGSCNIKYDALL